MKQPCSASHSPLPPPALQSRLSLLTLLLLFLSSSPLLSARSTRASRPLSEAEILAITKLDPPQWSSVDSGHMSNLLLPRAAGSNNNTLVQHYISSVFKSLGWHEEQTPFTSQTPIGDIDFNNLIYTFDPEAPRRLVLAAHFDSKWFPDFPANQFIGATDSAAPCAMLLDLAEALTPLLSARLNRFTSGTPLLLPDLDEEDASLTTLQLIFFDGEEAFHDWTAHDSVYGSRHLSSLWDSTYFTSSPSSSNRQHLYGRRMSPIPTMLETIDVLVLLDLLGSKHPRIHSYWRQTDWLHALMRNADERLRELGLVDQTDPNWFPQSFFHAGHIDDDHRPGVSILHVIANPFPNVWHTLADDASALDLPTLQRWNRILRIFVSEYLSLSPIVDQNNNEIKRDDASSARTFGELDST